MLNILNICCEHLDLTLIDSSVLTMAWRRAKGARQKKLRKSLECFETKEYAKILFVKFLQVYPLITFPIEPIFFIL